MKKDAEIGLDDVFELKIYLKHSGNSVHEHS